MKIKLGLTHFLMDFFLKGKPGIQWSKDDLKKPVEDMNTIWARPDVPVDAPDDLKDTYTTLVQDAHGKLVAGRLLLSDLVGGGGGGMHRSPAVPVVLAWLFFARLWMVVPMMVASFLPGWWAMLVIAPALVFFALEHMQGGFGIGVTSLPTSVKGIIWTVVKLALFYATLMSPWWVRLMVWPWLPFLSAASLLPGVRNLMTRHQECSDQETHFIRANSQLASVASNIAYQKHIEGRRLQVTNVLRDKSPVFDICLSATGIMTVLGDMNAPDKGKHLIFSMNDLLPGMVIFGKPRAGKTSSILRPLMNQIAEAEKKFGQRIGMFVFDNKSGALVMERAMADPDNFKMITPIDITMPNGMLLKATAFAMSAGVKASDVADIFQRLLSKGDNGVWPGAAHRMMSNFFTILETAGRLYKEGRLLPLSTLIPKEVKDENGNKVTQMVPASSMIPNGEKSLKWNVLNKALLLGNAELVATLMYLIPNAEFDNNDHLYQAGCYLKEYLELGDRTRSSIQMTAATWINALTSNAEMYSWLAASEEEGATPTDIFTGMHGGLYCPFVKFGVPGQVAEEFTKYKIFRQAQLRTDFWREVPGQTYAIMVEDEFQNNLGKGEQLGFALPMIRSLGLGYIGATQSIEGITSRMGKEEAHAMLECFPNVVCFDASEETLKYVSSRLGTIAKVVPVTKQDQVPVGIAYEASCMALAQGVYPNRTELYDQEHLENETKSYNEGSSGPNMAGTNPFSRFMAAEANMMSMFKGGSNGASLSRGSSLSYKHVSAENVSKRFIHGGKVTIENSPVFVPEEMARVLYTGGTAVVLLNRGEHPRKDIVTTKRVFATDINTVSKPAANDTTATKQA